MKNIETLEKKRLSYSQSINNLNKAIKSIEIRLDFEKDRLEKDEIFRAFDKLEHLLEERRKQISRLNTVCYQIRLYKLKTNQSVS